jgi:hypothetical protein
MFANRTIFITKKQVEMDNTTFLVIVALAAIVIIALYSGKLNASIGKWFNVNSEQLNENDAKVKGKGNKVVQGGGSNKTDVEGDENQVEQKK